MIRETLEQIQARIESGNLKEEQKQDLLRLLGQLKSEMTEVCQENPDQAQSIAGFTGLSAHEATRDEKNPQLLQLSLDGLRSSVEGFEKSHPRLVEVVNSISVTLSNLGI